MKPLRSLIPIGTATLLPQTAQRVRSLEDQLLAYLATWSYQEIILPTFEYLDVLSVGLAPEVLDQCYKFADRTSGRMLVLRPDATAQIARMVAMGLGGEALPLRFSYRTTVFRYEVEHRGRDREVFQVGIELVGNDSYQGDAEMVTMLAGVLDQVGLPEWKISLGHVGFFKALLSRSGLSPSGRKQAELAAAHKDLPRLEQILLSERLPRAMVRDILQVPERCGQYEVLEWGKRIAGKDPQLLKPLHRLEQVFQQLALTQVQQHVLLDLGEFRGFDYYDGVVFDVFTAGVGREIGGGGRYNHLMGRFGRDLPAIGFGLDLDRLFSALECGGQVGSNGFAPVLLMGFRRHAKEAFALAQTLRAAGICVTEETMKNPQKFSLALVAEEAQRRGISRVILYDQKSGPNESVLLVEYSDSSLKPRQSRVAFQELPQRLRTEIHGDF
ncbi:MAG: ATP phosphoribosyltransferase regulatory subunit [Nitrospirota bacterium]|nr:ATP phosphoribosyltransferase regulatory subunit [Nitrospirota bacterium]MDH5774031.1 ATP phosphoribosyltransferase regulatory subunit [Nitrospirota bacterium]